MFGSAMTRVLKSPKDPSYNPYMNLLQLTPTLWPWALATSADSPVSMDSLTALRPAVTSPSTGTRSPMTNRRHHHIFTAIYGPQASLRTHCSNGKSNNVQGKPKDDAHANLMAFTDPVFPAIPAQG